VISKVVKRTDEDDGCWIVRDIDNAAVV
jgi:hypothetical protein